MSNHPTLSIDDDQVAFFCERGYLVIESITTPDEVGSLREIYDRLFDERAGRDEGNQYDLAGTDEEDAPAKLPQIVNPVNYAPELADTLFRINSAEVGRRLLGEDAEYQGEHAIMKPPEIGEAAPWHQDEAYWKGELEYDCLSVWMALQDTETAACSSSREATSAMSCPTTRSATILASTDSRWTRWMTRVPSPARFRRVA